MKINVTIKVPDKYCNECDYCKNRKGGYVCDLFSKIARQGWNRETAHWDEERIDPERYLLRADGYNLLKCKMCEESLIE